MSAISGQRAFVKQILNNYLLTADEHTRLRDEIESLKAIDAAVQDFCFMVNPPPLRIIFMGTPDFAAHALQSLHEHGHQIVGVYTQPPRPAGRGMPVQISPVQALAEKLQLKIFTRLSVCVHRGEW